MDARTAATVGDKDGRRALKRRGILAAAGAAVAGIAAQAAARPVAAAGNLVLESTANTEATGTGLTYTGGATNSGAALLVTDGSFATTYSAAVAGLAPAGKLNYGVYASGPIGGVYGTSASGYGIYGYSSGYAGVYGLGGIGVYGGGSNYGVYGSGNNYGLYGSGGNYGVFAFTGAAQGSGYAGVYGASNGSGTYGVYGDGVTAGGGGVGVGASGAGAAAVLGVGQSGAVGVQGQAHGIGVYGLSDTSYGVLGVTTAGAPYSGVTGSITTATGAAFAGGASQASAFAAYFTGKVNIDGPFLVNGSQRFTLKHSDGTSRLVSGALTVEPVIEDFGKGQLANGSASIALDADFRDVADTSDYHVFLTEYGDDSGLYVATLSATGFEVRATTNPTASGRFSWRVVAKTRDSGGKVARLAKYEPPNIKIPGINGEPMPPEIHAPAPPMPEKQKEPPALPPSPPAPAPPPRSAPAATAAPAPAVTQPTATGAQPGPPTPQPAPPPRP